MQPDEILSWPWRWALFANKKINKKWRKEFTLTSLKAPNNVWVIPHNPSTVICAHKYPSFDTIPMYIIIYSVCHYTIYYMDGNWIVFSCLYSNQEIRLTDVPPILMATSSHHFFLAILPQLHLFSLFLLIFLSHSPLPFLSLFLSCLMCSLLSKEGNFHIESQPGSGDLDLTPRQSPARKMKMYSCVLDRVHHTDVSRVFFFASWKCSEIAVCYCWQTNWVHAYEKYRFFMVSSEKWNSIICDLHERGK